MNDPEVLLNKTTGVAKTSEGRAKKAFELEKKIKDLKFVVGKNFLELGRLLKEIRDKQYYLDLGYNTVTEWLNSPDVSISARWAWDFISVYEVLILEHKIILSKTMKKEVNMEYIWLRVTIILFLIIP